ncbi:helix-turn-helix domain-containing protein [Brevundimonas nasdae]|uniref:helix-turn-helix domain-containing protein n=1 Tax=Brevundimonas nasdae TaxID=172043 RepID=UPI0028A01F0D|nr:helix-turn-helix transcriptional regulator [Brevundimonas nasdae]
MTEVALDPFDVALGARIRVRREALKITQAQLATACEVTFQQIQKYERGINRVSAGRLALIAAKLKCHPGDLYSDQHQDDADDAVAQLRRTHDGSDLAACFMTMPEDRRTSLINVARALAAPSAADTARLLQAA